MSIRVFDADAPAALFAFLDESVSMRGREHWLWKYQQRLGEVPTAFYWEETDGRVLGFIGLMHTRLHVGGGQSHPAAWFVDWHVAPGERAVGVGFGLLRKAEAAAGSLLTLQGSADTRQILPRLGWKQTSVPATWVRPLSWRFVADWLGRRVPGTLRSVVRWASSLARESLAVPYLRVTPSASADARLVEVDSFPAEYDNVWRARVAQFAPAMARDSAYLNYLCAEFPERGYHMGLLRVAGQAVGHLIWRCDADARGLRRGRIVDLVWPRERPELLTWLVQSAIWHLQKARADYAECVASVDDLRRVLRGGGFRSRRAVPIWYHRLPPGAENPQRWYITYVDCDRAYR